MILGSPVLIVIMATLVGAALIGLPMRSTGRTGLLGGLLGSIAGAVGALIFMVPLKFCPFEQERTAIDLIGGLGLVALGMITTLMPMHRWIHKRPQEPDPQDSQRGFFKGWLTPILLLLPTLVILLLFLYYPAFDTLRLSTLLTFVGAPRSRFVCLDNYTQLFSDSGYLNSVGITFAISAAIIVIGLTLSLLIAMLAYQPLQGADLYRTLLIWPYAISPAVAGIIFSILFNPISGLINHILEGIWGIRLPWLNDPNWAPWAVIIASVWKTMGFNILFYIAGLQNLPTDLLEAAAIDGASAWRRFLTITVPLLSPITFFLVVTNMTYAFFDIFGTIDLLTRGGPVGSTSVMIYKIYEIGVSSGNLGSSAAQSTILFVMVVGLTVLQFRTTERRVNYGA